MLPAQDHVLDVRLAGFGGEGAVRLVPAAADAGVSAARMGDKQAVSEPGALSGSPVDAAL